MVDFNSVRDIPVEDLKHGDYFDTKGGYQSQVVGHVENNGVLVVVFHQEYSDFPVQMSTYSPGHIVGFYDGGEG